MAKQIRTITMQLLMKFLRTKQEIFGAELTLELNSDHSGSLVDKVTTEIVTTWNDLEELNEAMKAIGEYEGPNRPS